jgi:cyclic pyranopterin phosphate synthase
MPADTPDYCERDSILTFEEITRVVRIAAGLGVDDVRLTGGEPLVRSQLHKLVASIGDVAGVKKVSLTTNAILLADQLPDLHAAGLRGVNISLDALDEASFAEVTRRPGMQRVLDAIDACRSLGVKVKVNAIAMKDFTERQIVAFGEFTRLTSIPIRFIEFMPLDADGNWDDSRVLSGQKILDLFAEQVGPLFSKGEPNASPATDYTFEDGVGTIGIIASVTQPFCSTCNRFRLTADGQLRNCLFGSDSGDVRLLLRDGSSDQEIADRMVAAVMAKKRGHGTDDLSFDRPSRPMYSIGG